MTLHFHGPAKGYVRKCFTETRPYLVFAFRYKLSESGGVSIIFQHFYPVEPMFHMTAFRNNTGPVPLSGRKYQFVFRPDQIVERSQCPAAFMVAQQGVGMILIIQQLVFQADSGGLIPASASVTKYFMPLLAPFVSLKSSSSIKSAYSSAVTISPPFCDSLPAEARTVSHPFFTDHPFFGKICLRMLSSSRARSFRRTAASSPDLFPLLSGYYRYSVGVIPWVLHISPHFR